MKELLLEQRNKSNLTLRELSERTGIPKSTLHDMETGHKSMTLVQAELIAKALNIRITELYKSEYK